MAVRRWRSRSRCGARRAARTAIFAGARLADGQGPTHEELAVEALDSLFGRGAVCVFDKGEPARATRFPVERPHNLGRLADLREMRAQVIFGGLIGQVADEQSN